MLHWIIGVTVGLVILHGILLLLWGLGPILVGLPWYVPMMHGLLALAALSVSFLAFGRYRVLLGPAPFWIGIGFSGFAILSLFYLLSWPGLIPEEQGLIARLPNTSGWLYGLKFSVLALFLLVSVLLPWPRARATSRRWRLPVVAVAMVAVTSAGWLSVAFEQYLPILVADGVFTPLFIYWFSTLAAAFALGAVLSTYRYQRTGDTLLGYVAITQVALTFVMLTSIIGAERYDTWWYWRRIIMVGSFSIILFGLLAEYVGLYSRERDKSRDLQALQQITDPALARQGLEELLQSLMGRMVAIMRARAGAILLVDPERQELVFRKGLGVPSEQAAGLRTRVGDGFAGRVAAQNDVLWVRDARDDPSMGSSYLGDAQVRGIIGAPMRIEREVIGVVQVVFLEPREFTPQDERLLAVVAERAALAIHQERLLEEAKEERNRLMVLIDTAPIGIGFYSAPDGRVELLNRAAEAIVGQPPWLGANVKEQADYLHVSRPNGDPLPLDELPVVRSLRGEVSTGVEMLVQQPSGRKVYLLMNSSPIRDAEGQIVGVVGVFQDITSIKEQERLRDEFLATASHELKTPVTTIKGYIQLLQQWAPGGHDTREGRAFEIISIQADRINRRLQEMLEVTRYRVASPVLHRRCFDLGELVSQVVAQMQSTTEIHQIQLQQETTAHVDADRERIEEVLVGFLDNAIRYSPGGGKILVRVWCHEGEAMVSVEDQGVGISKDRQPHIFEPFYEPVPPGALGYRGETPLSLYLSKLTIERHGGRIWFESEEGKGSTFYFSLPMVKESNANCRR